MFGVVNMTYKLLQLLPIFAGATSTTAAAFLLEQQVQKAALTRIHDS